MERIYQLNIELKESQPKIWRRIQVSGETTFSELHDIIQLTMGWGHDHMYEFMLKKTRIFDFEEVFDDGTDPLERDSNDTFLDEVVPRVKTKFTYIYDFGDNWEHQIEVEKIFPPEEGMTYPICLEGERACPPEDSGGIWGYQHKLEVLADESHPDYNDVLDWIGEDWDPELSNLEHVNVLLKNYTEQWEDIYDETEEILEGLEEDADFDEMEESFSDYGENYTYRDLKKFASPEDVLKDEHERSNMKDWLKAALEEDKSLENLAYQRLRNSGYDDQRAKNLIMEALAIEWFYDLKYGTDHLQDRYQLNLQRLPEIPQELPRLEDALAVLDNSEKGIPYTAIEYLQNNHSDAATSAISKALRNHSDHQYCWADCTFAPFWYALAAEGHINKELIDPVIELYEDDTYKSEWLNDQGQYLIGKLAQKYPDLTAGKVLEAMEKDAEESTKNHIYYLFDAFYFCDIAKYKARLLALLERDEISWFDMLVGTFADFQITEGLPVLKRKLEKLKANPDKDIRSQHSIIEIEEAISILEGKLLVDPESIKPLSLKRETSWKDSLKNDERYFYENQGPTDDFSLANLLDQFPAGSKKMSLFSNSKPLIKEKTPERNDPCHCGSGKKYKKCCMDKDG